MPSGQYRPRRSRRFGPSEDYVGITEPGACEGMGRKPGSGRHPCYPHSSPPRVRSTFLVAALQVVIVGSLAQRAQAQPGLSNGTLQLSSTFEAFQCQNMSIAWQGGVPAYSLVVVSDHVEEFAGISSTSFQWLADAPLGTPVFFTLFDGAGARTDSPVFNVTNGPGSSDTCLSRASSSTSVSTSSSSSASSSSAVPTTSVGEIPTVLSFGSSASHLPPGAVAAIVVEAAVLTLSVVGLLIIFFLDRKDRAREPNRTTPAVDLLESPRPPSANPYPFTGESRSTTAASSSPQPPAKELPLRTGTVRRGPSPTIQSAADVARQSFTPSEATFVGISASPAASIRGSPSSSVRFAPGTEEKPPRKKRRTPLQQAAALLDVQEASSAAPAPPSAFPAERMQSRSVSDERGPASSEASSSLRDASLMGAGRGAVGGFSDSSDMDGGQEQEMGGEPRLLMARFGA